jgi:hypothetical protein
MRALFIGDPSPNFVVEGLQKDCAIASNNLWEFWRQHFIHALTQPTTSMNLTWLKKVWKWRQQKRWKFNLLETAVAEENVLFPHWRRVALESDPFRRTRLSSKNPVEGTFRSERNSTTEGSFSGRLTPAEIPTTAMSHLQDGIMTELADLRKAQEKFRLDELGNFQLGTSRRLEDRCLLNSRHLWRLLDHMNGGEEQQQLQQLQPHWAEETESTFTSPVSDYSHISKLGSHPLAVSETYQPQPEDREEELSRNESRLLIHGTAVCRRCQCIVNGSMDWVENHTCVQLPSPVEVQEYGSFTTNALKMDMPSVSRNSGGGGGVSGNLDNMGNNTSYPTTTTNPADPKDPKAPPMEDDPPAVERAEEQVCRKCGVSRAETGASLVGANTHMYAGFYCHRPAGVEGSVPPQLQTCCCLKQAHKAESVERFAQVGKLPAPIVATVLLFLTVLMFRTVLSH